MSQKKKPIIAIDGPSGAGKSTLSKSLARELGYLNIDTGAMYRSVALMADRGRLELNGDVLGRLCATMDIAFERSGDGERVYVNGNDVTTAIRTLQVTRLTPKVAAFPEVRRALVAQQRKMGAAGGVVLEGRDIGTVVFPHAEVKFFLSASAEERGRRRYLELCEQGQDADLRQIVADVVARDEADSVREESPLIQAVDAILIDSTKLSIDQVLDLMLKTARSAESQ